MKHKKKRIFLVDDNIVNLNTGESALHRSYTVIPIPSAEKMLLLLEKVLPDLILLDIDMPGMNGYEAIDRLKKNPETQEIPVIFLTEQHETADDLYGLELGAIDYIRKPFSPALLHKRVERYILMESQKNELRAFNSYLQDMVRQRTNEVLALQDAVIRWTAEIIEFRDHMTGAHVERVRGYLGLLFNAMKNDDRYHDEVSDWDEAMLLQSSSLHDVGKIKIKDDILMKKARLTDEEFEAIKAHTSYGKALIDNLQKYLPGQLFLDYAKVLAYCHHERWDGTGYPQGLKEEKIPLPARMMALADVYDALVSSRPYKEPYTHEVAMRIIRDESGSHFDPDLVELFESLSDEIEQVKIYNREDKNSYIDLNTSDRSPDDAENPCLTCERALERTAASHM